MRRLPCVVSHSMNDLERLRDQLRAFAAERDWDQFHSPKNLAMALSVEASELVEIFQWLTEAQSRELSPAALAAARDWAQFHSPKNLAMALSAEAAELLEIFQWLTEEQSRGLSPEAKAAAGEEVADVLLYLVRIADQLGIDPVEAARAKLAANARKYPVEKARGTSKKYTEL